MVDRWHEVNECRGQDFHLAKRHYDLAYDTNTESYLPVLLSLIKLHARSIWHTLMGGKNGLTIWDGDQEDCEFPKPPILCFVR